MAIYHFNAQIISKINKITGMPRSAVAAAAYRSGEELYNEQDGETKFYKRDVMPETYILCPEHAPDWANNRESLWNEVEKIEKRYDAQLAREINIALPRELSEEEQTKLALEFCQKNFVDAGMVADVCIHRDKPWNPHFHVMLTLRPINENGFMPKSKNVYELDKNGNKIMMASGRYKCHKENVTDWDKKETLQKWRKNWAELTNRYLEKNGIDERIDCRSYANQNTILIPTLHEGPKVHHAELRNQATEIGDYNKQVRAYNTNIIKLEEYKRERETLKEQRLYRCFTKEERQQIVSAAKQLKFYVNNENIEQRIRQLDRWEKSHFYRQGEFSRFERILRERTIISEAREILNNEAARFCEKYYEGISLLPEDKLELVSRTIDRGHLLSTHEIDSLKLELREREFREVSRRLLTNGNVFWLDAVQKINREELRARENAGVYVPANDVIKIDSARGQYHIFQDKETNATFIGIRENRDTVTRVTENMTVMEAHEHLLGYLRGQAEIPFIQYNIEKVERLEQALCVMDKLYDEQIHNIYGDAINTEYLSTPQKEMILHYEEYYGTTYINGYMPAPPYSTQEKKEIISLLLNDDKGAVQSKYPKFKDNNAYMNMFVMDCLSDNDISEKTKENLKHLTLGEAREPEHNNDIRMPISPHTLISQLLRGIESDMKRQEQGNQMSNHIRRKRKRHEQEQNIV